MQWDIIVIAGNPSLSTFQVQPHHLCRSLKFCQVHWQSPPTRATDTLPWSAHFSHNTWNDDPIKIMIKTLAPEVCISKQQHLWLFALEVAINYVTNKVGPTGQVFPKTVAEGIHPRAPVYLPRGWMVKNGASIIRLGPSLISNPAFFL